MECGVGEVKFVDYSDGSEICIKPKTQTANDKANELNDNNGIEKAKNIIDIIVAAAPTVACLIDKKRCPTPPPVTNNYNTPAAAGSSTLVYVAIGIGVLALIGTIIILFKNKKK